MKIAPMEAEVLLEALGDADCQLDHNGDCQEHTWFGINGKCPVALSKELISDTLKGGQDPQPALVDVESTAIPAKIANRNGLTVGELVAFLQTQDQALPVAAECGCSGGWSSAAKDAYLATGTATEYGPCVKVGWGGSDD